MSQRRHIPRLNVFLHFSLLSHMPLTIILVYIFSTYQKENYFCWQKFNMYDFVFREVWLKLDKMQWKNSSNRLYKKMKKDKNKFSLCLKIKFQLRRKTKWTKKIHASLFTNCIFIKSLKLLLKHVHIHGKYEVTDERKATTTPTTQKLFHQFISSPRQQRHRSLFFLFRIIKSMRRSV